MNAKVVVAKLDNYAFEGVHAKIKDIIETHFPLNSLFFEKKAVVLKPNLLMPVEPDAAITTHPSIVAAAGCIFKERGLRVCIGDNPSAIFSGQKSLEDVYHITGISEVARQHQFELLYPRQSFMSEDLPLSFWARECAIINIAKLKTHAFTVLTAATKNLYGCISGAHKTNLHKMHPHADDFVRVLLQLYRLIKPALHIVDAIVSLEGEGPARKGKPKHTGFIVVGNDALAIDYVISSLINLKSDSHPLIKKALALGLIEPGNIELISEVSPGAIRDFSLPSASILNRIPPFVVKLLGRFVTLRPAVIASACTGCAACLKDCPNGAITMRDGKACIDYRRCIMCMCCNEVCRYQAIKIDESMVIKIVKQMTRK